MKKKLMLLATSFAFYGSSFAQLPNEVLGIEQTYVNHGKADNGEEISLRNFKATLTVPIPLKTDKFYLMNMINYAKTKVHYGIPINTNAQIQDFQTLQFGMGVMKPFKNNWFMMVILGASTNSNFESGLKAEYINPSLMFSVRKEFSDKMALNFGGLYDHGGFVKHPLPSIFLEWKPNEKWELNLGVPDMAAKYNLTKSTSIGTNLFMAGNRYTLSGKYSINNKDTQVDHLNYMDVGAGLEIRQKFWNILQLKVSSGYTFYRNIQFQNNYNNIHEINTNNSYYINAGIAIVMD